MFSTSHTFLSSSPPLSSLLLSRLFFRTTALFLSLFVIIFHYPLSLSLSNTHLKKIFLILLSPPYLSKFIFFIPFVSLIFRTSNYLTLSSIPFFHPNYIAFHCPSLSLSIFHSLLPVFTHSLILISFTTTCPSLASSSFPIPYSHCPTSACLCFASFMWVHVLSSQSSPRGLFWIGLPAPSLRLFPLLSLFLDSPFTKPSPFFTSYFPFLLSLFYYCLSISIVFLRQHTSPHTVLALHSRPLGTDPHLPLASLPPDFFLPRQLVSSFESACFHITDHNNFQTHLLIWPTTPKSDWTYCPSDML